MCRALAYNVRWERQPCAPTNMTLVHVCECSINDERYQIIELCMIHWHRWKVWWYGDGERELSIRHSHWNYYSSQWFDYHYYSVNKSQIHYSSSFFYSSYLKIVAMQTKNKTMCYSSTKCFHVAPRKWQNWCTYTIYIQCVCIRCVCEGRFQYIQQYNHDVFTFWYLLN